MEPENYDPKQNLLFDEYQSSGSIAQVSRNLWFLILMRVFRGFVHILWPFPIHAMISNWHKNPARMAHLSLGRCRCTVAQVCGLMGKEIGGKQVSNSDVSTKMRMFFHVFSMLYKVQGTWLPLIFMVKRRFVVSLPDGIPWGNYVDYTRKVWFSTTSFDSKYSFLLATYDMLF